MMLYNSSRSRVTNVAVIDNKPMLSEHLKCLSVLPYRPAFAAADLALLL